MSHTPNDTDMIAALLDGTATGEERAAVLRDIAADRDQYARFVETVHIRAALDAEPSLAVPGIGDTRGVREHERRQRVTPIVVTPAVAPAVVVARTTTRSASARRLLAPLMLAASLIAIVTITRNASVRSDGAAAGVLEVAHLAVGPREARGNGTVQRALGAGAVDPAWTVMRGSADARVRTARAYRAGVRVAQFEIAALSRDSIAAGAASVALLDLLRDVDGSAPMAASLNAARSSGTLPDQPARTTVSSQIRALTGAAAWFDLGVWTESARHAAYRPRPEFFEAKGKPMDEMRRLLREQQSDVAWQSAASPLRALLQEPASAMTMEAVIRAVEAVAATAGE